MREEVKGAGWDEAARRAVAEGLRTRLAELEWSSARLVRESGVSEATVASLLNAKQGRYRPATLMNVSRVLGWPPTGIEELAAGGRPQSSRDGGEVLAHGGHPLAASDRSELRGLITMISRDYTLERRMEEVEAKLDQVLIGLNELTAAIRSLGKARRGDEVSKGEDGR